MVANLCYSCIGSRQLNNIKSKICQTLFNEKYNIEVEEISPPRSVIITNVDESKRTKEFLDLYFSNSHRCRVCGFDSVELLDNGQVLVHFEDSQSKPIIAYN